MAREGCEALRQHELEIGLQQNIELTRFGAVVVFDDLEHAEPAQAVRRADLAQLTPLGEERSIECHVVREAVAAHRHRVVLAVDQQRQEFERCRIDVPLVLVGTQQLATVAAQRGAQGAVNVVERLDGARLAHRLLVRGFPFLLREERQHFVGYGTINDREIQVVPP